MKKFALLLVLLLLAGGGYWYHATHSKPDAIKILETRPVKRGEVRKILEATGIVKAQVGAQLKIGAQATGVLTKVNVKVGDHVKAGQIVAEIDDREIRARIAEAEARLELAQAKLDYAQKNLPRRRELVRQRLESQDTLDQALQDAKVARFDVEATRATLRSLRVQLSYYTITSPIDGVVSQVTAQEGETVVSGLQVSNLITVLAPEKLEMWIYVDETDVGRTQVGQPVEFHVDAYPERIFHGSVDRIYPEPEIRDNIVYYRALVQVGAAEARLLRPEMTTQCQIIVETRDDVLTIPNSALKWVKDHQVVYRRGPDGSAVAADVKLGLAGLQTTEVLSGLSEGDEVATQLVIPGAKLGEKGL